GGGAGRRGVRGERRAAGMDVVVGGGQRIGPAAVTQRGVVVGREAVREVHRRRRQRVERVVRRSAEGRSREERAVGALGQRIVGRRVVVEDVALRALVADAG